MVQFKNYRQQSFHFGERVTAICGNNGAGKTNLLDAIHYLCFTRSYFTRTDSGNVLHGCSGFRLEGKLQVPHLQEESVVCVLRETGKKEFMVNEQAYDKFSKHIGRYPCVVIAPDDASLITGNSEERRKFMDALLAQLDPAYLQQLILYTKLLQQRNSLLKSFAEKGIRNDALLEVLEEQMAAPGDEIFRGRQKLMEQLIPRVQSLYQHIAGKPEIPSIFYESELQGASMKELFKANRQKDYLIQRTASGIHRDELEIRLGERSFKQTASQGQRKSLLFALKLAEMEMLRAEKGFSPLLLLDDVFEKLDEQRIANLLQMVCVENDGQVFITDTDPARLQKQMDRLGVKMEVLEIEN